jgi:basic membrane protein A
LGWDINDPNKGLFSSSFDDQAKGRELGVSLMDEGADVILPVAGPVGLGTAAAVKERGDAWIIGVDSDWYLTGTPDTQSVILTSVFKGGSTVVGTLPNNGVGLAPFHDADSKVPAELKTELETVKAGILNGSIKTRP